jgi:hypothetical protein
MSKIEPHRRTAVSARFAAMCDMSFLEGQMTAAQSAVVPPF